MINLAMEGREPFHLGITVPSLHASMEKLGREEGLEWAIPVRRKGPILTPAGQVDRDMWITYSCYGPFYHELVEYVDDTAYQHATGGPPKRHVGYWSENFHDEIDRLESLGLRCELSGVNKSGERSEFAYHLDSKTGLWIELVDVAGRDTLEAWTSRPYNPN